MGEPKVKTNVDYLVTETAFDPKSPPATILDDLLARKTTGQFVIHLSRGGIQKVELVEKTRAKGEDRSKIRGLLGWTEK